LLEIAKKCSKLNNENATVDDDKCSTVSISIILRLRFTFGRVCLHCRWSLVCRISCPVVSSVHAIRFLSQDVLGLPLLLFPGIVPCLIFSKQPSNLTQCNARKLLSENGTAAEKLPRTNFQNNKFPYKVHVCKNRCLTLLEIYWKFMKSPGNFLV